jgi:hypothetical protein
MNKTTIRTAIIILAFFLAGCDWDFGPVDEGYRGVFIYPAEKLSGAVTISVAIEDDLVTFSSSNSSTSGTAGTFQLTTFHISSAKGMRNTIDGAHIYALYNGLELLGYFDEGEKDIFFVDYARQDYFIRRGSSATYAPDEPEEPEEPALP